VGFHISRKKSRKSKKSSKYKKDKRKGTGLFIDSQYEEKIDEMHKKTTEIYTNTARDVLLLAASLAVALDLEPTELPKGSGSTTHKVNGEQIKTNHQFLLNILHFYKNKDYNILLQDARSRKYGQELANSGLQKLIKIFIENDFPNFELIEMIIND